MLANPKGFIFSLPLSSSKLINSTSSKKRTIFFSLSPGKEKRALISSNECHCESCSDSNTMILKALHVNRFLDF